MFVQPEKPLRITKSGEIDKRHYNGNNGTRRGRDIVKRQRCGFYVLKEEVRAGLTARLNALIDFYGGPAATAKALKVTNQNVNEWKKRGMVSVRGAELAHIAYRRNGCKGFRASFLRFDIKFDSNGKAKHKRCQNRKLMRVVRADEDFIREKPLKKDKEAQKAK